MDPQVFSSNKKVGRVMTVFSQAQVSEVTPPRHLQQAQQASSSLPSPSLRLEPSSPPSMTTHQPQPPPPPLILTPAIPEIRTGGRRVDSLDLWAAAGEAGVQRETQGSAFGFDYVDEHMYRNSPTGPPSDNGEGGSGYYTPSYASSYGSFQEDSASFIGDAFDGKLDVLDLSGDSYNPDADAAGDGGLGGDVVGWLETWGLEQRTLAMQQQQQQQMQAPESAPHAQGGAADDSYKTTSPVDPQLLHNLSLSQHPTPDTMAAHENLQHYSPPPPNVPFYSLGPAGQQPQPLRPPSSFPSPAQIITQLPLSNDGSPGSARPQSAPLSSQRSPVDLAMKSSFNLSASSGGPFDSLPSASTLFPSQDPKLHALGLLPNLKGGGLYGPNIEISPATPLSALMQAQAFNETLAGLSPHIPMGHPGSAGPVGMLASQNRSPIPPQHTTFGSSTSISPPLPDPNQQYDPHQSSLPPQANQLQSDPQQQQPFYQSLDLHMAHLYSFGAPPPMGSDVPPWSAQANMAAATGLPFGQQPHDPLLYLHPALLQQLLAQQQSHSGQQLPPPQQFPSSFTPPNAVAGPSVIKTTVLPASGNGSSPVPHPHLKQPPKRQRSRSDASALPYDFGPIPPPAPTMNPNLLSSLGGSGSGRSFFPGQQQQMDSPTSSPRSVSAPLAPASEIPPSNPLPPPPNAMLFHPVFPSYESSKPGGNTGAQNLGDPLGPRRTSQGSAQRSFGAGTPGYGVGMLNPWGLGEIDAGGVRVKRSLSDAGKGRKGHRKVQSVDLSYTRPDGTLGVPIAPVRTPRRISASGGSSSTRSPARSPTPELRPVSTDDADEDMMSNSDGSSVSSVTRQNVTTTKTAAASKGRRKSAANFVCPIPGCGSTFTRSFNLKGHLRSHTDERPFKCTTCQKSFARAHDCKRHMALHVGYRPHVCLGCDKRFARLDALSRHLKSDAGQECVRGGKMAAPADGAGSEVGHEEDEEDGDGGSGDEGGGWPGKGVLL